MYNLLVFSNGNSSELEGVVAIMLAPCTGHMNADKIITLAYLLINYTCEKLNICLQMNECCLGQSLDWPFFGF